MRQALEKSFPDYYKMQEAALVAQRVDLHSKAVEKTGLDSKAKMAGKLDFGSQMVVAPMVALPLHSPDHNLDK